MERNGIKFAFQRQLGKRKEKNEHPGDPDKDGIIQVCIRPNTTTPSWCQATIFFVRVSGTMLNVYQAGFWYQISNQSGM